MSAQILLKVSSKIWGSSQEPDLHGEVEDLPVDGDNEGKAKREDEYCLHGADDLGSSGLPVLCED